jgi:hypothetical protein
MSHGDSRPAEAIMRSATLLTRPPHRDPRSSRDVRIPLRRRLRAIGNALLQLFREVLAASGSRRGREDFLQVAAREARERDEAIDSSVGAMSQADIRRIAQHAPDRRSADQLGRFPY